MILQFGTSRFLQAHVDLFVSEALAPKPGEGPITVVQTTNAAEREGRVAAFDAGRFPVHLRGLRDGDTIDRVVDVRSVSRGLAAAGHWAEISRSFVQDALAVISNTGDRGYELDPADGPNDAPPGSFPAKLLTLLLARFRANPAPLDLYPCELIRSNGDVLRRIVLGLARTWSCDPAFLQWAEFECRWVNSLVDRIVSAPLDPIGAVAEPYALWAIETQPGLEPVCRHPDIVLTDRLVDFEQRKLFILNLGHTALVELWRDRGAPDELTVREAVADPDMRAALDRIYETEIIPAFAVLGQEDAARDYLARTLERFSNPFLDHRLRDIAVNHDIKIERRFGGIVDLVPDLQQPWLRARRGSAPGPAGTSGPGPAR